MKQNLIRDKTFELAKSIVALYQFLANEKREYVLSKQLLRSGTSVGANTAEGIAGQSRKDFSHYLNIANKEARETYFWLILLKESLYLPDSKAEKPIQRCDEVIRILCTILRTPIRIPPPKRNNNFKFSIPAFSIPAFCIPAFN